ncbi:SDR family oxidoreductase, partial [Escherichia coli]|nr:SDR family oxidoreductase [Escherichia coli]
YIINTAAVLIKKPINFMSDEDIEQSCNTNYLGAINIAREGYGYLKKTKGMLINFTSSSFTRGRASYSLYSSSKAAVVNLTQALSEEWLNLGIKVNCINPERTDTPMRRVNFGIEPPESLLTSEQVADMTLSIMSSDYTGQVVAVKK